jgi:transcription elongation factor Elf1
MENAGIVENPFLEYGHKVKSHMENKLPFSCPICGRKKEYLVTELVEGAVLTCPFCKLTITLHGHMWKDIQKEIQKLKGKA